METKELSAYDNFFKIELLKLEYSKSFLDLAYEEEYRSCRFSWKEIYALENLVGKSIIIRKIYSNTILDKVVKVRSVSVDIGSAGIVAGTNFISGIGKNSFEDFDQGIITVDRSEYYLKEDGTVGYLV